MSGHEAIEFAGIAGELLLRNGAETSRVEDTIKRICEGAGFQETEVIVFTTGIIINGNLEDLHITKVKRIADRDINLTVVSLVNDLSRQFSEGQISLDEGMAALQRLAEEARLDGRFSGVLAAGALASGSATVLLGGSGADVLPAVIATGVVRLVTRATTFNLAYVLRNYVAGFFAGMVSRLFVDMGFGLHLDKIIVGALLPLVPGVALTNAIRDFISGDLLSGTLRMVEALLVAAALAGGVGFALALYSGYLRNYIF